LASRWTSFVAVEMTEEQVPLGFGDRDEPEAQEPEGSGLNLLRRRAVCRTETNLAHRCRKRRG
jgi:hypothetical protein